MLKIQKASIGIGRIDYGNEKNHETYIESEYQQVLDSLGRAWQKWQRVFTNIRCQAIISRKVNVLRSS